MKREWTRDEYEDRWQEYMIRLDNRVKQALEVPNRDDQGVNGCYARKRK